MTNRLNVQYNRVKEVYKKEGLFDLIKRTFTFLLSWLSYENSTFYIYELELEKAYEAIFTPKLQDVSFKAIETTQQLDELLNCGFDLSLLDIAQAYRRLEKEAILTLIFVKQDIAYRGWLAITEEAKNTFNPHPYKVDFSNNEACGGGSWTNPKYRRQGIYMYSQYKRAQFLLDKGIRKKRGIVNIGNKASLTAHNIIKGLNWYAKGRYLRIGRMQFWKETPVESTYSDE